MQRGLASKLGQFSEPDAELPQAAHFGDVSGPLRTRISSHSAIALASRRPQRGHRGPPVPREMFQAFPGDYDSGSRCSSSPSAESQYLSSVDSFGSPPTAAASQVSSRSQRCYFGGHGKNISLSLKCGLSISSNRDAPKTQDLGKQEAWVALWFFVVCKLQGMERCLQRVVCEERGKGMQLGKRWRCPVQSISSG